MVQPREDKNDRIMQAREPPREPTLGRPPEPGEVMGHRGPPFEVVGLDALSPALLHVRFPATLDDVVQALGSVEVPIDKWRTASVAEILDLVALPRFESKAQLEDAVNRSWTRIRDALGHAGERGGRNRQGDDVAGAPR